MSITMLGRFSCACAGPANPGEAAKRIEAATPLNMLWKIGRPGRRRRGSHLAGLYIVAYIGDRTASRINGVVRAICSNKARVLLFRFKGRFCWHRAGSNFPVTFVANFHRAQAPEA